MGSVEESFKWRMHRHFYVTALLAQRLSCGPESSFGAGSTGGRSLFPSVSIEVCRREIRAAEGLRQSGDPCCLFDDPQKRRGHGNRRSGTHETDEDFSGEVEFTENGTAIYKEDGDVITGTWSQSNDKLTLSIPDDSEDIDMSGTYTIQEISGSKLKLYIEKEETFEDPDTGVEMDATIKATLYFTKR